MNARLFVRSICALIAVMFFISPFVYSQSEALAQTTPGLEPGIVASGYGRAAVPASSAEVQVIVSQDFYGSDMYLQGGSFDIAIDGTPVSDECDTLTCPDEPEASTPVECVNLDCTYAPPVLSEDDLAPIVDAVVAAGVPQDQIQVIIPAFTSMITGFGSVGGAQLRFSVDDPAVKDLAALAVSVNRAATSAGLSIQHIGVVYLGDDCAALLQEAEAKAVADAQARAERLAGALGATLGDLTQAADSLYFGPYGFDGSNNCEPITTDYMGPYGEGILPAFDPSKPAEAVEIAQVTLTYSLVINET
jgi:hypothetical protein